MKNTFWLILAVFLATGLRAQQTNLATPKPAPIDTPAAAPALTNTSPAATHTNATHLKAAEKKKSARKSSKPATAKNKTAQADLKTVPLIPGPAVVVANNVNVRGRPGLIGEVITHITKDQ